jgi:hypothetical protein
MARAARATKDETPTENGSGQRRVTFPVHEQNVQVGARLRALRQVRGLSMEQVAQAIGVDKSIISRMGMVPTRRALTHGAGAPTPPEPAPTPSACTPRPEVATKAASGSPSGAQRASIACRR